MKAGAVVSLNRSYGLISAIFIVPLVIMWFSFRTPSLMFILFHLDAFISTVCCGIWNYGNVLQPWVTECEIDINETPISFANLKIYKMAFDSCGVRRGMCVCVCVCSRQRAIRAEVIMIKQTVDCLSVK